MCSIVSIASPDWLRGWPNTSYSATTAPLPFSTVVVEPRPSLSDRAVEIALPY